MPTIVSDTYSLPTSRPMSSVDILSIEAAVRKRIFQNGYNAAGKHMARARAYPAGFYRYATGQLFRGLEINQKGNKLQMVLKRSQIEIIRRSLERRYGIIFAFDKSEQALINKYAKKLIR